MIKSLSFSNLVDECFGLVVKINLTIRTSTSCPCTMIFMVWAPRILLSNLKFEKVISM